ncbi:MAG: aldo/keto reductase [Oscillospiraceae bacterium]|nr:aldo/keto reductase [Oscillospiraceae bacterium]
MKKLVLGKTGLEVTRPAFGVLPLQRVPMKEAVEILQKAYDYGINYYDSANGYSDSEEKIGNAFSGGRRENVIISTKSGGKDKATVTTHIELSLRHLQTDYIDILQLHNPSVLPDPNDSESSYAALVEAKEKGYIRHIGITNHSLANAKAAIDSGLYETLQFPFSYLASQEDLDLVAKCKSLNIGFIAMKGLAGGLLTNARVCAAFMEQFDNVAPIWGIQRMSELEEWVALAQEDLTMTDEIAQIISEDNQTLGGNFCRACGYCAPCPVGIEINTAARMKFLLLRSPYLRMLSEESNQKMHLIDDCLNCRVCVSRCPYSLEIPALLKEMLSFYDEFRLEHINELV